MLSFYRKNIWLVAYVTLLLVVGGFWWPGVPGLWGLGIPGLALAVGRLAGLLATVLTLGQFVLMSHLQWLERSYGLDKLTRFHRLNGQLAIILLLGHPVLVIYAYSRLAESGFFVEWQRVVWGHWSGVLAVVGLALFILVVTTSIRVVRSKWPYEAWYFVHLFSYLAIVAGLFHQFSMGETVNSGTLFFGFWIALYVLVGVVHLVFRILAPIYRSFHHDLRVSEVRRESQQVVSVFISGRELSKLRIVPGQFMIFRFLTAGRWWQAHPFSISQLPEDGRFRITVKALGDFTDRLPDLPIGSRVIAEGPFGVFTHLVLSRTKVLLIAGGIGITPIRVLLEEMVRTGVDVVLLYSGRFGELVFRDEIDDLISRFGGRVEYIYTETGEVDPNTGRLDREKIKRLVPDLDQHEVYICGPDRMMVDLRRELEQGGLKDQYIHVERFALI